MHHGLQRSGTNYLLLWLHFKGIAVINHRDPCRDSPLHKHCRWQHDKATLIDPVMRDYANDFRVSDVDELDAVCALGDQPLHLVLLKERIAWLTSMANWGLNVGWFADKPDALAAIGRLAADYDAYAAFWQGLARAAPDRVMLAQLDTLLSDPAALEAQLAEAGLILKAPGEPLRVDEVPRSPADRAKIVTREEVRRAPG